MRCTPGRRRALRLWGAFALLTLPAAGAAQVAAADSAAADSLRQQYRLQVPTSEQARGVLIAPAPLAPGVGRSLTGDYLSLYAGVYYTRFTRYNLADHDAVGMLGVGFGDPSRWLGLQSYLMLYSTVRSGLFNRMGLTLEANRFLFWDLLLTVGWENVVTKGVVDNGESRYAMLSRWFLLGDGAGWFSALALTAGAGDGRFVSAQDWIDGSTDQYNLIGSVALQVASPVMLLASWMGDDLFVGMSVNPFGGLVITPGVADVTGQISSGARFVVSAGYDLRVPFPWAGGGQGR